MSFAEFAAPAPQTGPSDHSRLRNVRSLDAHPQYARGVLGYAEVDANQAGITAVADLDGLAVTVTVATGRRVRVTGWAYFKSTVPGDTVDFSLLEGDTRLKSWQRDGGLTNANSAVVQHVLTPTPGFHTYKLAAERSAGTGDLTMNVADFGRGYTAYILVEDIGQA